jgi:hypothetical protein
MHCIPNAIDVYVVYGGNIKQFSVLEVNFETYFIYYLYLETTPLQRGPRPPEYASVDQFYLLNNNTPSNAIVNAASNISNRLILEAADVHTGRCYMPMFLQFFL